MSKTRIAHLFRFIAGLALAAGLASTATRSAADPLFGPSTEFGANSNPQSVAVGDLNGDGKLDVAVACYDTSMVAVLLGDGAGGLAPHTDFVTGIAPTSVVIADLDADGHLDLVTSNKGKGRNLGTVSVLLGNGDGTFGPRTDYGTGDFPQHVAVADLNADDKLDLVTANFESVQNKVSVLLGNGDGSFGPKTDYSAGYTPVDVAIGDLNGDGKPDLVTANWNSAVNVLLGNGDGSFGPYAGFSTWHTKSCVALGDLDADGNIDVVTATLAGNSALVFLGNGDGSLGPWASFHIGDAPHSAEIGDLDADGIPDLAVANWDADTVAVLLGNGDGTFEPRTDYGAGDGTRSVAIADLNGDGRPDLVTANAIASTVSVLLNIGTGTVSVGPDRIPARFELAPPRPNPFRAGTTIEFGLPSSAHVRLEVYDVRGRRMKTLQDGVLPPGTYARAWDGTTTGGTEARAGIYFIRYAAPGIDRTTRAALIR